VISSWYSKHEFDIKKLRDQRLRHHFQARYDSRANVADWDYQFGVKEFAPLVMAREYKDWRLTGIAFETRLSSGVTPNRTMSSFTEGKKVS